MARDEIPFDEDMMTLIMGVGGPEEPGQHGRTKAPYPTEDAISVLTQIRDLCDDFLMKAGKEGEDEEKPEKPEKKPERKEDKGGKPDFDEGEM